MSAVVQIQAMINTKTKARISPACTGVFPNVGSCAASENSFVIGKLLVFGSRQSPNNKWSNHAIAT